MNKEYKSILMEGEDSFEEKKSLFIGYSSPVESEDHALDFIKKIKEAHKDATHNCSAYIIGPEKLIQRFDDDGEPSGTAGIPMLEVIKKEDLTNICLVVTRYFGGIKLGGGGLIRAYSKGAKVAIDAGQIVEMKPYILVNMSYDYFYHGKIQNSIDIKNYKVISSEYTDIVSLDLLISEEKFEDFKSYFVNLTSGTVKIEVKKEEICSELKGELIYDK